MGIHYYSGSQNSGNSTISIEGNTIDGGSIDAISSIDASYCYGISLYPLAAMEDANCDIFIFNNTINGGLISNSGSASVHGIYCNELDSPVFIGNNTIKTGAINTSDNSYFYGIYRNISMGNSYIVNNIIFSTGTEAARHGIFINDNSSIPTSLSSNDIFDVAEYYSDLTEGSCIYFYNDTYTDVVNTIGVGTANANVNADFVDQGAGDWNLTENTITAVSQGGLAITEAAFPRNESGDPIDKDGNVRTVDWSMGAYERD